MLVTNLNKNWYKKIVNSGKKIYGENFHTYCLIEKDVKTSAVVLN